MPSSSDRTKERRRRRRRDSYDEYDEDSGGISGWKLGLVMGVIVVCFAMLYPTLFHPMLMGFLGRGSDPKPSINQQRPPMHPAMGGGGGGQRHPGGAGPRPDVHPAMRMAQAQGDSGGGGKGMFTWMLPIYTVGVVVFLLYTLFKSKTKSKKRKSKRRGSYMGSEDEDDDESDVDTKYGGKFGKKKLRGLQERLRQTEEAMSKILEQLESVQAGGTPIDFDAADKLATNLEKVMEDDEEEKKEKEKMKVGLNEKNEQYISDLEVALREFQTLSKEYDLAKMKKLKKELSSSEEEDEEEEEEEEEEEVTPMKVQQKSTSEEEEEQQALENEEEEEGIDIDQELIEQEKERKKAKEIKNLRRRKAKKI